MTNQQNKDNTNTSDMQQLSFSFCDAPTGHGKTTAIINTVNSNSDRYSRFLIVSPYLSELDRIAAATDCLQPTGTQKTKQQDLQQLLAAGINVCCTHALFNQLTSETLELLRYGDYRYNLIIDEEPTTLQKIVGSR